MVWSNAQHTHTVFQRCFGLLTAVGFAMMPAAASAQALEEITVTAQKREEGLQDVPISISALTGDKLAEAGIQRFEEASAYVPNFTVRKETIGDRISIRGLGSGNQAGFEQSVGTFVDGVYRGRSVQSRFAFLDIGRIEVLRGPQGTLFGKNTIAGALNITSAKPTDELDGAIKIGHNPEFDETEINAHLSGGLSDTVRARVAVLKRDMNEGWGTNTFPGYDSDTPQVDELAGRLSLEWDISDSTAASLKYEHGEWDNTGQPWDIHQLGPLAGFAAAFPSLGLEDNPDRSIAHGNANAELDFGANHRFEGELDEIALNVTHDLERSSITAVIGYSDYDFDRQLDADYNPLSIARFDDREDFDQFSAELRIASDGSGAVNYIAGIFYQDASLFADGLSMVAVPDTYTLLAGGCAAGGGTAVVVPGDPIASVGATLAAAAAVPTSAATANACRQVAQVDSLGGVAAIPGVSRYALLDQDTETIAVFGQLSWDLSDAVTATVGLRYTEEEKDARQSVVAPEFSNGNRSVLETNPGLVAASTAFLEFTPHDFTDLSRTEESFTWSANLQWHASDTAMLYGTASTGFKGGGFNSFYMGQQLGMGADPADADFGDEDVLAFEVGAKLSLLEGAAELNLAYFNTEFDNLQVSIFSGNTTFEVQNAAKATTQGIEIDGRWQATDNLLLSGSFGWTDFSFDEFVNQACTSAQFTAFRETAWANGTNPFGALANNGNCAAAGINDLSGRRSAFTPEYAAVVSAVYEHEVGNFGLRYGLDVIWRDDEFVVDDLDPGSLSDGVTKLNGSIRLVPLSERWELALLANNITDVDDDLIWTNDMPLVNGAQESTIARGRSYVIQGAVRFY